MPAIRTLLLRTLLMTALLVGVGCEDTNNDFDHDPPDGRGSLIVDNQSPNDLIVYVDGIRAFAARDGHWEAVDLRPGVHRVVVDDEDSNDAYGNDVDILAGRQTILGVTGNTYGGNSLQFSLFLD